MQPDDSYNSGKQQRVQRRQQRKYGDVSVGSYGCFLLLQRLTVDKHQVSKSQENSGQLSLSWAWLYDP
jgi:hypothetical protein